jgi:peptidoglycan/xylan/chitin deacetylase (PgdA/CDA1 family)
MKFVVTIDDAGLQQSLDVEHRSMEFLNRHGVPATFFVVPCSGDRGELSDDESWVRRAREYEARGHDYQLHGCTHEQFEFGPPEPWMVQICGEAAIRAEADGFRQFWKDWTPEALRRKFDRAVGAFQRAFERTPQVFRAGCLAAQEAAFECMAELGLLYDSNKIVNPRTWDLIARKFDSQRPWDSKVKPHPYLLNDKVVELATVGEYAWELSDETIPRFVNEALADMQRVREQSGVFILMCHQQRVGAADTELPRTVLTRILSAAKSDFKAEFMTLQTLVEQIECGAQPVEGRVPTLPSPGGNDSP